MGGSITGNGGDEISEHLDELHLKFQLPKGKVASIMGIMNLLQSKFDVLEIEIIANKGKMLKQDFEDKIQEAFNQLGIKIK